MREALTPAKRRRIMEAVGNKCEIRGCKSKAYEVHHIKPVSEGGTNVGSNLVVLCANHHSDAHNGTITRTELREVVKNRSEKKKREINNIHQLFQSPKPRQNSFPVLTQEFKR